MNDNGQYSYGGRSQKITVNQRFVTKIPESYPLESAAIVMCPGVTMFAPLKKFGALHGNLKIGIIGFGSLGQWAAKIAIAMGNKGHTFLDTLNFKSMSKQFKDEKVLCWQLSKHRRGLNGLQG